MSGILKALGLDPRSPQVQALAHVARKYDLQLLLDHIFLVQNKVYISHAGLLHIAHRSDDLDGIETVCKEEPDRFVATSTVWRKSMAHPFSYQDECLKNEKVRDPRKRAVTRAERNALRRAFDVVVDVHDQEDRAGPVALSEARPALPAGEGPAPDGLAGGRREGTDPSPATPLPPGTSVVVRCRELNLTDDQRHDLIRIVTQGRTDSTKEITPKEAVKAHLLLHDYEQGKPWSTEPETKTSDSSSPPSNPRSAVST